jgi:hypothetical protein
MAQQNSIDLSNLETSETFSFFQMALIFAFISKIDVILNFAITQKYLLLLLAVYS